MKIALGTKNLAKKRAVEEWASQEFDRYEVVGVSVESGVSDMPMSDVECLEGALNRAMRSLKSVEGAELGIGMEGGVEVKGGTMFLCGWVVIVDKNGSVARSCSGHVEVPQQIRKEIEAGKELGPLLHELHDRDVRNNEGAWGLFTNGKITRSDAFRHSLSLAYAKFGNDMYE